jgi:hypothetical protein
MKTKWIILGSCVILVLLIAGKLFLSKPELTPLPPRYVYASLNEAYFAAGPFSLPLAGTGSMYPWIPKNKHGRDSIVGYAVVEQIPFNDLRAGDVIIYHDKKRDMVIIHRLVNKWGNGWLASGDSNSQSDYNIEITENVYDSRVKSIHVVE